MRKLISVVVLTSMIFLSGCNNLKATYKSTKTPINNDKHYEDLITKEIDILEFAEDDYNGLVGDSRDVKLKFGLECLRKTQNKDGTIVLYSVHKVKQGGLLYVYYNQMYIQKGGWYYVKKKLSYADFSAIDEGSTPEEVLKIDPATQVYLNELFSDESYKEVETAAVTSFHYLTDGCMHIHWHYKDGEPRVGRIVYFENYQEASLIEPIRTYYNRKVLDKDTLWYDPEKAETESE